MSSDSDAKPADTAKWLAIIDALQNQAKPLREVFIYLDHADSFGRELHLNELGAVNYNMARTVVAYAFGIEDQQEKAASVSSNIERTRKKSIDESYFLHNYHKYPFAWLAHLLSDLYFAKAADVPINHSEVNNVYTEETFAACVERALAKETAAKTMLPADEQPDPSVLADLTHKIAASYIEGVDAKEYAEIIATTLKKADAVADEPAAKRNVRKGLIRVLESVAQAIAPERPGERHV